MILAEIPRKYLYLGFLAPLVIALDQSTKRAVIARFQLGESISLIEGFFSLTYVRNTGAAFGLLADAHPEFRVPFFLILPFGALAFILGVLRKIDANDTKIAVALALVFGGAVGNLIDRALYGYVVDFLDFHWKYQYHFPAFNIADSAICVGVVVLMWEILFENVPSTS
jgi:signal peptidase II